MEIDKRRVAEMVLALRQGLGIAAWVEQAPEPKSAARPQAKLSMRSASWATPGTKKRRCGELGWVSSGWRSWR
jgi:hypothetical protein